MEIGERPVCPRILSGIRKIRRPTRRLHVFGIVVDYGGLRGRVGV